MDALIGGRLRGPLMRSLLLGACLAPSMPTYAATAQQTTRAEELRERRLDKVEALRPPDPPGPFERLLGTVEAQMEPSSRSRSMLGIQPKLGGLKPGAGITGGIRFAPDFPAAAPFVVAEALGSVRRYWGIGTLAGYRWRSATLLAFSRFRHMPSERFFGFGPNSKRSDRSDFGLNEGVAGGLLEIALRTGLSVGGRASYVAHTPSAAGDDETRNAIDRFPGEVPSLQSGSRHLAFGGWIEYDGREPAAPTALFRYLARTESDIEGVPLATHRGIYALAEIVHYEDVGATRSSFSRVHLQSQQFVPFRRGHNVFVFREYLSLSNVGGSRVPLYMQPTLGGANMLRGYELFRFRDRH